MGEFERNKDQLQAGVQAGASLVGRITVIITDAVGAIAREVGDFVTDGIEMREAARTARADEESDRGTELSGRDGDRVELDDDDEVGRSDHDAAPDSGTPGTPGSGAPGTGIPDSGTPGTSTS